jgi:hypothetical protein
MILDKEREEHLKGKSKSFSWNEGKVIIKSKGTL